MFLVHCCQIQGRIHGGGAMAPLAANFLNVVCEFSVKFFLFFGPYYQQICGKEGKFAVSLGRTKAKRLSASAPGPRWRLHPQTPAIGSRSCARHVSPLRKPSGSAPGQIAWSCVQGFTPERMC